MRIATALDRAPTFPILAALLAVVEAAVVVVGGGRLDLLPGGLVLVLALALVRALPALAGPIGVLGVLTGGTMAIPEAGLRVDGIIVGAALAWGSARYGGRLTRRFTLAGLMIAAVLIPLAALPLISATEETTSLRIVVGVGGVLVLVLGYLLLWRRGRRSARTHPPAPLDLPGGRELDAMNTGSDTAYALLYLAVVAVAYTSTGATEVITIAVLAIAVAVRRRHPAAALALAWIGAVIQMALLQQANFLDIAILAVLFAVAAYGTRRVQVLGAVSAVVGALVASVYNALTQNSEYFSAGYDGLLTVVLMFGVAVAVMGLSWTAGALSRVLRVAQEGRAGQQRAEDAQAAAQRELDAVAERNAIARDMHDVVAHSLAVVIAQADGARYLGTAHPEQTDQALSTISSVARDALGDVRQLLAQLRHSEASGPQPSAADLPSLLDSVAASGRSVVRDFGVELDAVPRGAGLALFRIAQEATTNALRHGAPDAPISVVMHEDRSELVLLVRNRRADAAVRPGGHGLVGMRERALLAGGSLRAEPDGDDFLVEARLPRIRTEGEPTA